MWNGSACASRASRRLRLLAELLAARETLGDGNLRLTVLTVRASRWNFGTSTSPDPGPAPDMSDYYTRAERDEAIAAAVTVALNTEV